MRPRDTSPDVGPKAASTSWLPMGVGGGVGGCLVMVVVATGALVPLASPDAPTPSLSWRRDQGYSQWQRACEERN